MVLVLWLFIWLLLAMLLGFLKNINVRISDTPEVVLCGGFEPVRQFFFGSLSSIDCCLWIV